MSAPTIPIPADVEMFGEISAVKATIGEVTIGTTPLTTEVVTASVRSTGDLNLRSASDAVVVHADVVQGSGAQSLGKPGTPWSNLYSTSGTFTTVNATTVNNPSGALNLGSGTDAVVVNADLLQGGAQTIGRNDARWAGVYADQGTFGNVSTAGFSTTGSLVLDGAANTGVVTTTSGKQLVLASNGQTTPGAGSSASIQMLGNSMYLNDGADSSANIALNANNTTVATPLYCNDQVFVQNNLVLSGAGNTGVLTAISGQKTVISANGKTSPGAGTAGSVEIVGNAVYVNDGNAAQAGLKLQNGRVYLDNYTISQFLAKPRFGYAIVHAGDDTGSHNFSTWAFDCTNGSTSAYATWSEDSILRLGNPNVVAGFQVVYEGLYCIEAATGDCSASARFKILINGVDSLFSAVVASGSVAVIKGIVHLGAGNQIYAQMIGGATCIKRGSYISVTRLNGQTGNIKFLQSGNVSDFANQ